MIDLLWLSAAPMCRISPWFPLSYGVLRVDDRRLTVPGLLLLGLGNIVCWQLHIKLTATALPSIYWASTNGSLVFRPSMTLMAPVATVSATSAAPIFRRNTMSGAACGSWDIVLPFGNIALNNIKVPACHLRIAFKFKFCSQSFLGSVRARKKGLPTARFRQIETTRFRSVHDRSRLIAVLATLPSAINSWNKIAVLACQQLTENLFRKNLLVYYSSLESLGNAYMGDPCHASWHSNGRRN